MAFYLHGEAYSRLCLPLRGYEPLVAKTQLTKLDLERFAFGLGGSEITATFRALTFASTSSTIHDNSTCTQNNLV